MEEEGPLVLVLAENYLLVCPLEDVLVLPLLLLDPMVDE